MRHEKTRGRAGGEAAALAAPHGNVAVGGRRRPLPRRERRGMINVMLTIAIAAIVIGAMLAIYTQSGTSLRTQETQTTLTAFVAEIRRSFANARQFTNENYETILASRMPSNALRGAAGNEVLVTAWGGVITASGGTTVGTDANHNTQFWIRVDDLPQSACETIATAFLNRRDVTQVATGSAGTVAAVTDRAGIEDGCDATTDDNSVGVVFRG